MTSLLTDKKQKPADAAAYKLAGVSVVSGFILLILTVTVCLYIPVWNAPFLFDDYRSILDNPDIRTLDLKTIYAFKPLRFAGYLSFALNFHFFQLDPLSYHLVNIGIHLLYGLFTFFLIQTLWKTPSGRDIPFDHMEKTAVSLAVAALLLLHPVSVFAVSYVVQRLASLTALFYVITLLCYLRSRLAQTMRSRIWYALCAVAFMVCALFSKENAFTLFPQILLLELLCFPLTSTRIRLLIAGALTAAGISAMVVFQDLIDLNEINRLTIETRDLTRWEYLLTQFSVLCFYLRTFFIPRNLALDYDRYILDSLLDPQVWIPGAILAVLLGFAVWLAMNKSFRLAGMGLLFYFIAASVESGIIPISDTIFLHRVYLPNLGLALCTVILGYYGLKRLGVKPVLVLACFCLWLAVLSWVTFQTNMILRTPVKAWERVLEVSPGYFRAMQSLNDHYITKEYTPENHARAREYIFTINEYFPDNVRNLIHMGILLNKEKAYDRAIACFERVIQLDRRNGRAYTNLGITWFNLEQYEKAMAVLEKGFQRAPEDVHLLLTYGQVLAILAPGPETQYRKALSMLERAEAIDDRNPVLYYSKGLAWYNLQNFEKAKQQFSKVLEMDPSFVEARQFLEKMDG